ISGAGISACQSSTVARELSRSEVLKKPLRCRPGALAERVTVDIEMAALQSHELLGVQGTFVGRECRVGYGKVVTQRDNEQERGGTDEADIAARLVFAHHLDGAERHLVLPGWRP